MPRPRKGKPAPAAKITCKVKYATTAAAVNLALLRHGSVIGDATARLRHGSATLHLRADRHALRAGVVVRVRLRSAHAPVTISTLLRAMT